MLNWIHQSCVGNRVLCLVAVLVTVLTARLDGISIAAEQGPAVASEYYLKLVRLDATSKFIGWPDESTNTSAPFVIGVIAPDPFKEGLQKLSTRKLKDRPIQIVIITSVQNYQSCHLLFFPKEAKPEIVESILKLTANKPVLVWRDEADPLNATGVSCTFVRQGDSLMIEANPAELKRRKLEPDGLRLSLNPVRVVKTGK